MNYKIKLYFDFKIIRDYLPSKSMQKYTKKMNYYISLYGFFSQKCNYIV